MMRHSATGHTCVTALVLQTLSIDLTAADLIAPVLSDAFSGHGNWHKPNSGTKLKWTPPQVNANVRFIDQFEVSNSEISRLDGTLER